MDSIGIKEQLNKKRREAALNALTFFISKYSPATKETADTFFTTAEIAKAIAQHTGVVLDNAEVYELLLNMKYTYEEKDSLEFFWLLRKE